ncbi:hypothetical protein MTR_8g028750 [Medicago truncatula]|uniref:Uncharacterized protein n=1 Tax=Medicago truncatula TaxID=3880 RepID=A0A072TMU8_MEDTR|nr:hypothetical protein MTR_8g028750 [Medicago truncatula]
MYKYFSKAWSKWDKPLVIVHEPLYCLSTVMLTDISLPEGAEATIDIPFDKIQYLEQANIMRL